MSRKHPLFIFLILAVCCLSLSAAAREWRNRKGQRLDAEFERFEGKDVIVVKRTRDGKTFRLKYKELSEEDQKHVDELWEDEGDAPAVTPSQPKPTPRATTPAPAAAPSQASGGQTSHKVKLFTIAILIVINIPLYFLLGRAIFHDFAGLMESVKYCLTPNIISWFRGEYMTDRWETFKFQGFMLLCIAMVVIEYLGIAWLFFH